MPLTLVIEWPCDPSQKKFSQDVFEMEMREEGPFLLDGDAGKWKVWELQ